MDKAKKILPAFTDERGAIYDIVEDTVNHVGIIESKKGALRGEHYHKKSTQYTFVISGKMEFYTKKLNENKVSSVILGPFDLVVTPAGVIHAMRALEDTIFLDLTTESRDKDGYEKDTIRAKLNI